MKYLGTLVCADVELVRFLMEVGGRNGPGNAEVGDHGEVCLGEDLRAYQDKLVLNPVARSIRCLWKRNFSYLFDFGCLNFYFLLTLRNLGLFLNFLLLNQCLSSNIELYFFDFHLLFRLLVSLFLPRYLYLRYLWHYLCSRH